MVPISRRLLLAGIMGMVGLALVAGAQATILPGRWVILPSKGLPPSYGIYAQSPVVTNVTGSSVAAIISGWPFWNEMVGSGVGLFRAGHWIFLKGGANKPGFGSQLAVGGASLYATLSASAGAGPPVLRWSGRAWVAPLRGLTSAEIQGNLVGFYSVTGLSNGDVLYDNKALLLWNGHNWIHLPSPSGWQGPNGTWDAVIPMSRGRFALERGARGSSCVSYKPFLSVWTGVKWVRVTLPQAVRATAQRNCGLDSVAFSAGPDSSIVMAYGPAGGGRSWKMSEYRLGGTSWKLIGTAPFQSTLISDAFGAGALFAVTTTHVYRWSGRSWMRIGLPAVMHRAFIARAFPYRRAGIGLAVGNTRSIFDRIIVYSPTQ